MGYIWDIYGIYIYIYYMLPDFIDSSSHHIRSKCPACLGRKKKKGPSLVPQVFHVHWSFGRWSLVWLLNKIYDLYVF